MKEKSIISAYNKNLPKIEEKIQNVQLNAHFKQEQAQTSQGQVQKQQNKQCKKEQSFNPMLARPLRIYQELDKFCLKKQDQLIADIKYDGERSLIYYEKGKGIQMISRNGKHQKDKYYKIAKNIQNQLKQIQSIQNIILDGQIVSVKKQNFQPLSIQVLLARRRKLDSKVIDNTQFKQFIMDDENVIELFYCFDVLQFNNQRLFKTKLIQRKKIIQDIVEKIQKNNQKPSDTIIKRGQYQIFKYSIDKQKLMSFFSQVVSRKYEGLIIKGTNDFYYSNGSRIHWGKLKKGFKVHQTDVGLIDLDLILMGADKGKGKKSGNYSSFLLGTYHQGKIHPISKVGTGFTQDQLQQLTKIFNQKSTKKAVSQKFCLPNLVKMDVYFEPFYVIQVKCQQFSRSPLYNFGFKQGFGGISLRFPVFDRIRDDKNIEEASNGSQILAMIQQNQ